MSWYVDTSSTTQVVQKSLSNVEDPVVLLEWNLYGHPLAGLLWERQFEECTHRECKPNETNFEEYRKMFDSRISAGATQKIARVGDISREKLSHRHMTWNVTRRSAQNDIASGAKKTFQKRYNGLYS